MNGPSESGRSRVKMDDLLTEIGRSSRKWMVLLKVDDPSESGGPGVKWTVSNIELWDGPSESG